MRLAYSDSAVICFRGYLRGVKPSFRAVSFYDMSYQHRVLTVDFVVSVTSTSSTMSFSSISHLHGYNIEFPNFA